MIITLKQITIGVRNLLRKLPKDKIQKGHKNA
jgi:hypothetical protein